MIRRALLMKRFYITLGLLGVVFVVFLLGNKPALYILEAEKLSAAPDYFLEKIEAREYNDSGEIIQILTSNELRHFEASKQTLLTQPHIEKFQKNAQWHASGMTGKLNDKDHDVLLTGNAKVYKYSEPPQKKVSATLSADVILYNEDEQSLKSQGNASLVTSQGTTRADSILTYISNEKAYLKGNVIGHYENQ